MILEPSRRIARPGCDVIMGDGPPEDLAVRSPARGRRVRLLRRRRQPAADHATLGRLPHPHAPAHRHAARGAHRLPAEGARRADHVEDRDLGVGTAADVRRHATPRAVLALGAPRYMVACFHRG